VVVVKAEFEQALRDKEEHDRKEAAKHGGKPQVDSRLAIFKDWKHLRILLVVAVLEFGANAYYYGVQFSLGQIGTDFGYNILLTGIIETTAFFATSSHSSMQIFSSLRFRDGLECSSSTWCAC
jgi:hypothetical protein